MRPRVEELEPRCLLSTWTPAALAVINCPGGTYAAHGGNTGYANFVELLPQADGLLAVPGTNSDDGQSQNYTDPRPIVTLSGITGATITCDPQTSVYTVVFDQGGKVWATQSLDEGQHWAPPVVVLDEGVPAGSGQAVGSAPVQLLDGVTVNVGPMVQSTWVPTGDDAVAQPALVVDAAWVNSLGRLEAAEAVSLDGGLTWSQPVSLAVDQVFVQYETTAIVRWQ